MKTKILTMALGFAAMFSSCQKDESGLSNQAETKATFSVAINDGVTTRTVTGPATAPTRYIMEIYALTNATDAVSGTPEQRYEEATGSFTVMLKEGANYACLFWADYGIKGGSSNEYNTADLKSVKVVGQATKMAFGGSERFTYDSKAATKPYLTPTLTHAVAQVNYKQTEDFTANGNTLKVEFPKTYSLNLDNNATTEIQAASASVKATHTFASIVKASKNTTIGTSYIIVADATQTVMDIKATFNEEVVKDIANVPFQRNYRTNISGAYSNLYETTLTATCEDAWEATDNDVVFPFNPLDYYGQSTEKFKTDIEAAGYTAIDTVMISGLSYAAYIKGDALVLYNDFDATTIREIGDMKILSGPNTQTVVNLFDSFSSEYPTQGFKGMIIIKNSPYPRPHTNYTEFRSAIDSIEDVTTIKIAQITNLNSYISYKFGFTTINNEDKYLFGKLLFSDI